MSFEDIIKTLIPTFEPGQRVLIHNEPFEFRCPRCGAAGIFYTCEKETVKAVIICKTERMFCSECDEEMSGEGWYTVRSELGIGCVPYTLLEAIED